MLFMACPHRGKAHWLVESTQPGRLRVFVGIPAPRWRYNPAHILWA